MTDIDGLTGLPEYRNGGLFIDAGVLALKSPEEAQRPHTVDSTLVVEWRALTVALLDEIAERVRKRADPPPNCRSRKCWRAEPGPPAGASRARNAPTDRPL